jgi:hypothetical protein
MRKIADKEVLSAEAKSALLRALKRMERAVSKLTGSRFMAKPLATLPPHKRIVYERILDLVYECSQNRAVAKALVDKMLSRLS